MCSKVFSSQFVALVFFSACVHLSHQAGNLSQDVIKDREHDDHHQHHHHHHEVHAKLLSDPNLWLSASGAILIISLCGIFGVLIIPLMQKVFYQHLIQFLVALAIGTLAGDALLHLIPHALMFGIPLDHNDHEAFHSLSVWKGFTALLSLLLFFVFEKMINILGEWREKRNRFKGEKKVRIVRSGHKTSDRVVGERICKHKYSSYCVNDIDLDAVKPSSSMEGVDTNNHHHPPHIDEEEGKPLSAGTGPIIAPNKRPLLPALSDSCLNSSSSSSCWDKNNVESLNGVETSSSRALKAKAEEDGYETVFIREHEHVHHGHSHAHSHFHSAPNSISSVAWMVIFGDGIHNLADGMAIGAAFSESYMSGISTTIAVLCHELPHEIGDFAMLLKAGMSFKQAVFYNFISSVLAFIGMIAGILLGNLEAVAPWIFMVTAGIFLYVALVDMIPELNSGHAHPFSESTQNEFHFTELLLQFLGMATGAGIMLLIALYEHDLKEIL
ncbi:zinc transporter foi [Lepeophtheirus salmonis]|uniref:zinc transporter foi n=1 Tax=Lepeophtheirus salmonis TaxID=72036 RepID=UPI001AE4177A|nr:zinc transporter foi-like [Lepeophtheirus salmonis]XP_040578867.1 zinc transporter foi-like [Lepeophtheirus salmonis]XP_040578874.1 zinc transporter foi-like [Lepeophtheirus salmonis]XP_040578883.1 zinc transporter foi-like [Lepeophtheirus salmonis]